MNWLDWASTCQATWRGNEEEREVVARYRERRSRPPLTEWNDPVTGASANYKDRWWRPYKRERR